MKAEETIIIPATAKNRKSLQVDNTVDTNDSSQLLPTTVSQAEVFAEAPIPIEDIIIWSPTDLEQIKWTAQIIREVEATHRNLGLALVFAKLCDMSNLGAFITGPRASGKTTIIRAIQKYFLHRISPYYQCDFLTPRGLKKVQQIFTNNSLSVYNYDFSSLSSEYLRDKILGMFSSLIYDHSIHGESMGLSLDVHDCYCSFISTIQPGLYREISKLDTFESQYKDRYLRYFLVYFRPILHDMKHKLPRCSPLPFLMEDKDKKGLVPRPFPELPDVPQEVKDSVEYKRFVKAIATQTSMQRAGEYANRLLQAHAYLNDRKDIRMVDAKFCALFIGFLNMELFLSDRDAAADPLKFNADAYTIFDYIATNGSAKIADLEKHFQIKRYPQYINAPQGGHHRVIKTHMKDDFDILRAKKMITGIYGMNVYRVHDNWEVWYRRPVLKFLEKIGA